MWREACAATNINLSAPLMAEIKATFKAISFVTEKLRKFCFFIDGLDEYSRDHTIRIKFLEQLAKHKNFILVDFSRPTLDCVDGF